MTPEAQRIALAKACGWEPKGDLGLMWHPTLKIGKIVPRTELHAARIRTGLPMDMCMIPDYCNDLNAIHEAENLLLSGDPREEAYYHRLVEYWEGIEYLSVQTPARVRAETLLLVLGLWVEDPPH